ncbi:Transcription factor BHLH062, partial [Camellia lanceoleosa]
MSMVSEASVESSDDNNVVSEEPIIRSSCSKNNPRKVPKKIHKAEREKLKRDHLNDLFLKLGNTLDPSHENNGKAFMLSNATRLLRDLLAQVDCLKRENTTLLSESHY